MIFGANLLERLYSPKKFLKDIEQRLNKNGLFILTSSYNFDENITNKEEWLGKYKKDGENYTSFNYLKDNLEEKFELKKSIDIPLVFR